MTTYKDCLGCTCPPIWMATVPPPPCPAHSIPSHPAPPTPPSESSHVLVAKVAALEIELSNARSLCALHEAAERQLRSALEAATAQYEQTLAGLMEQIAALERYQAELTAKGRAAPTTVRIRGPVVRYSEDD